MLLMVEENEVRQLIDANPVEILACPFQAIHLLDFWIRLRHRLVTAHARWQVRDLHLLAVGRGLVAAVTGHCCGDMTPVTESDRL